MQTKATSAKRRPPMPTPPPPGGVLLSPETEWPWPLRPYQQDAFDAFQAGKRRQLLIWHRRAGKDMYGLSLARQQSQERVGAYWHFFPKHSQAKRALWEGVDPRRGRRFIDLAFGDLVARINNTDMLIEFANGSTWQLLGSDNYDRIVGGNAVGVVFSEWALCNPKAWDFLRPIVRENKGWASFITTYRGRNHAWRMVQRLKDNPQWYVDVRTVEQTTDQAGNRIITDEDIAEERREGMSEALIQQEYYCSPTAGIAGAIYARQVAAIQDTPERRLALWQPLDPVVCAWNLDNFPASVSFVVAQAGRSDRPARVLAADTLDFTTFEECAAWVTGQPFAIHHHLVDTEQQEFLSPLADLGIHATLIETPAGEREALTQGFLATACVAEARCPQLLESLMGYTRTERQSDTDGTVMYGNEYDYSWHAYQANAVELVAAWVYHSAGDWSRSPDYRIYDRRRV